MVPSRRGVHRCGELRRRPVADGRPRRALESAFEDREHHRDVPLHRDLVVRDGVQQAVEIGEQRAFVGRLETVLVIIHHPAVDRRERCRVLDLEPDVLGVPSGIQAGFPD